MIESSEPVLTALRAADPAVSVTVDETIAFPALRRARAPLPKRRRRWGWGLVVAVALAAIAIPAGAVASSYVAHTGWFGSPNPGVTEGTQRGSEADGSEWLEITAPDFVDAAAGLMPAYITLPTGYNPEHFAKAVATRIKQQIMNGPDRADTLKYGSLMQTTGFV
ncbi:MAG: hypothetical protein ABJA11_01025, partial [Pseudolysinimonas sp.]